MLRSAFSKKSFNCHNINHLLETKIFFYFIIFFCFAFQILSHFTHWTDTELYPTHSSQYLFSQYANEFLFALKPLFYFILKLSFSLSSLLDLLPMTVARFLFAFNGLAILALMYFYVKNKTNRYNAILTVLFLASLNIFLDRAFRVRSDLLSTCLSLICLLINLNITQQKETWRPYILIPLLTMILLISPKGIYWVVFTSVLLWHDLKNPLKRKSLLKITVFMFICLYLVSLIFKDPFFIQSLYKSAEFYLLNLSETYHFVLQNGWLALYTASHIGLFINRNPFLILITVLKALFIIHSLILSRNRKGNLSDLHFLILVLVALFHPQQKLFFLSALSPFFCMAFFTDQEWKHLIKHKYSKKFKTFLLTGAFIYAFSHISYFNYKNGIKKNNLQQKALIKELNEFYKSADLSINISDPNCIIYTRKTHCKYILDTQSFQHKFLSYIYNNSFDVILSSFYLFNTLLNYEKSYFEFVNIKNHIYYRAFIIDNISDFTQTKKTILKPNYHNQIVNTNNSWTQKKSPRARDSQSQKSSSQFETESKNRFIPNVKQPSTQTALKNQTENLSQKQVLSGEKILESFEKSNQIKVPKQYRKYFYLYIDRLNSSLNKNIECKNSASPIMQEGCYYSEDQLKKSFIPLTNKKIALFYIPFPFQIKSEKSLRILLRYDIF